MKKLLAELGDLPAEAEEEARTIDALQVENRNLKRQLRLKPVPEIDEKAVDRAVSQAIRNTDRAYEKVVKKLEQDRPANKGPR